MRLVVRVLLLIALLIPVIAVLYFLLRKVPQTVPTTPQSGVSAAASGSISGPFPSGNEVAEALTQSVGSMSALETKALIDNSAAVSGPSTSFAKVQTPTAWPTGLPSPSPPPVVVSTPPTTEFTPAPSLTSKVKQM